LLAPPRPVAVVGDPTDGASAPLGQNRTVADTAILSIPRAAAKEAGSAADAILVPAIG